MVGQAESWLPQVGGGRRDIDSLTVIRNLATALDLAARRLMGGQPAHPHLQAAIEYIATIKGFGGRVSLHITISTTESH